ncbi:CRISPR-associated helicase Cas3' [Lactobacillus sp. CC-MHH1034]|uniref:CRISPR-associated helicase Cas3' n=1 Tax=Agrilactobacillus fermenti TaxID=2586909 RepID=UPI001E39D808|nr:CRISPR-associated helicase Cas3' [Agrilactobacillus fermenti]MCD2257199.1 CRISPR-associated helicase Cas3' [Agrilactobacillus fermenti]
MTYYAKSEKVDGERKYGETIAEHTNHLLEQFHVLKQIYPDVLNKNDWTLLKIAAQYHDLGKMNSLFQKRLLQGGKPSSEEIPHALLSVTLVPIKEIQSDFDPKQKLKEANHTKALIHAIAYHHERDFSHIELTNYQKAIDLLKNDAAKFDFSEINNFDYPPQLVPQKISNRLLKPGKKLLGKDPAYHLYVMIKGLLNRLDYAAGGHYQVEYSNDFLPQALAAKLAGFKKDNPNADWNEMQHFLADHADESQVVIAQTGMGKTEGALLWLKQGKGFFVLPLIAAINSIYDRIVKMTRETFDGTAKDVIEDRVGVLHSGTYAKLISDANISEDNLTKYAELTRAMSLPLTVTTLDQIFTFVFHPAGFERQLATLAYSKVVIDEIQNYDPQLLAYIIYGLKVIQDFGGQFLVMTATLPPLVIDLMRQEYIQLPAPNVFLDTKITHRHRVKTIQAELEATDIIDQYRGDKMLVICNTVKKATNLYRAVQKLDPKLNVHLLHSRFIRRDRNEKVKQILATKNDDQPVIWITTQIVEASVDIDFDILLTELSELSGLFQRMGRVYRRRNYDGETPNVLIYDGGEKTTSGIGSDKKSVVDIDMFQLSKAAIQGLDRPLSEQDKLDLINETFTTENLKDSQYYERMTKVIGYLKAVQDDNPSLNEVKQRFRDVTNVDVMPQSTYDDNQEEVDHLVRVLNGDDPKARRRLPRIEAQTKLEQYLVPIAHWRVQNYAQRNLGLKYLPNLKVVDVAYSSEIGVDFEKFPGKTEDKSSGNNIF